MLAVVESIKMESVIHNWHHLYLGLPMILDMLRYSYNETKYAFEVEGYIALHLTMSMILKLKTII